MKNLINFILIIIVALNTVQIQAQGNENFDNLNAPSGEYGDGSFVGEQGLTWTYEKVRIETSAGTYIAQPSAILRNVSGKLLSPTISGGISSLSFEQMRAWSRTEDRTFTVTITDIVNGITKDYEFVKSGIDSNINTISLDNLDIPGEFSFVIHNTGDRAIVIDNINWIGKNITTSITTNMKNTNVNIFSAGSDIIIEAEKTIEELWIYSITGDLVCHSELRGLKSIEPMSKSGCYVVKVKIEGEMYSDKVMVIK